MAHTQIFYTNSARFASQLAPGSSYETINLLPSIWQGGGLKSITSIADVDDLYNTNSWIPQTRRQTGSIIYDKTTGKYYKDAGGINSSSGYVELAVLNGGSVSFAGLTSSAGILITGGNLYFSNGGNIATTGTASFERITTSYASLGTVTSGTWNGSTIAVNKGGTGQTSYTNGQLLIGNTTGNTLTKATLTQGTGVSITNGQGSITIAIGQSVATTVSPTFAGITLSNLTPNTLPIASTNGRLINSQITDNGSLITLGRATYVSGNFQANGTASATQITASTGFTSSTGYIQIGGGATSSTGFYSPGTSNLTTLNVATISGSGLATFTNLYVPGNTQLGNAATDTTSVFGTLSIVNAGSTSGSITCDSSGNLILDGSGAGGVEITDGLMYLGSIPIQSGSYSGTSYYGGMISSSMKVVALHGFANRTSDGAASFEVDTLGNLECASLKETSLRQYKHEIHYITESQLLNISKLKPVTFLYNQDVPQDVNDTRIRQAGFIAEQVQQIYPEVAWYKEGKLAGLQYQRLTAYLTRGIQELAEQNKLLKSRVQSLEQLVNGILQGAK